ncbi:6-phosphogluconolactonase [Tabrizicola oligotrophica]|uniref:Glucosamine/galactosamine-6-phosphate isomerase domain-containing protein n=1 Tax=Tabrizicola oligotrophica TaxID=2710650 RepID=A0A6M0QYE1_9RHOB|nr:6-phosphogluconolactonase [Tabrizicola oligotrophica]NEY91823.1 hypothetical protein [Tabrizicola oligotrophica]
MTTANPCIFDTPAALGLAVARDIADRIAAAKGQRFLLGCPGGRSPQPVYAALAGLVAERGLDLSGLVIVMMDDYVIETATGFAHVDAGAHFSCRRFAWADIQAVLNAQLDEACRIPAANVWFPDPAAPQDYDRRIAAAGGVDYFLLASGAGDGHIAFNPPGSPKDSLTRVVKLAEQTRRDNLQTFPDFASIEAVPQYGVTVGIETIRAQSRAVGMVVWGAGKRAAYRRLASAASYDPDWPATIYALCANATLYADRAAVGQPE